MRRRRRCKEKSADKMASYHSNFAEIILFFKNSRVVNADPLFKCWGLSSPRRVGEKEGEGHGHKTHFLSELGRSGGALREPGGTRSTSLMWFVR